MIILYPVGIFLKFKRNSHKILFCTFLVRDGDTVKHYRIRQLDQGGFYIARRITFRTLQEMVAHYSRESDGLCVNLRKPCVRVSEEKDFILYRFWSVDDVISN